MPNSKTGTPQVNVSIEGWVKRRNPKRASRDNQVIVESPEAVFMKRARACVHYIECWDCRTRDTCSRVNSMLGVGSFLQRNTSTSLNVCMCLQASRSRTSEWNQNNSILYGASSRGIVSYTSSVFSSFYNGTVLQASPFSFQYSSRSRRNDHFSPLPHPFSFQALRDFGK